MSLLDNCHKSSSGSRTTWCREKSIDYCRSQRPTQRGREVHRKMILRGWCRKQQSSRIIGKLEVQTCGANLKLDAASTRVASWLGSVATWNELCRKNIRPECLIQEYQANCSKLESLSTVFMNRPGNYKLNVCHLKDLCKPRYAVRSAVSWIFNI